MIKELERRVFRRSLEDTRFFRRFARRTAYLLARGDPEAVHELALRELNRFEDVVAEVAPKFDFPDLHVGINGRSVMPFGTAAGLDKNGDALCPLSHLFGFLEPGTVVVQRREGNERPRVAVDDANGEIYNAQGFPNKGLYNFLRNAASYRERGGEAPLLISICGIPPEIGRFEMAYRELEELLDRLCPYADGFVWNPFSPNTVALTALRTPEEFRRSADTIAEKAEGKLKLVKMGPYDRDGRQQWLDLVDAWIEGGGDGIVAVNTYMVPREKIPARNWGYPSAGRSGPFLKEYRQLAVRDCRGAFPDSFIIATGGIDSGEEAWHALQAGADALEGYTPYTFHGFGLLPEMASFVQSSLRALGYAALSQFQNDIRRNAMSCAYTG
ncbi:MAG: hypothetical protein HYW25_00065 [Candidatus Aenigmarchaeota archaeon]|nr:hypothetical protein [Candidatus Aenigmarchaeota archaeon]